MTGWTDRVSGHAVSTELATLASQLNDCEQRAEQDAESTKLFARMRATEKALATVLTTADPLLVADSVLNGLANNIQPWRTQLTAFASNGNVGHLQNAMGNVDGVLTLLAQVPTIPTSRQRGSLDALRGYTGAIQSYMETVESRYTTAQSRADELVASIDQLTNQVNQVSAQTQNIVNVQQQQFSEKQEERINEFGNAQQERAAEYTSSLNQQRADLEQLRKEQGEHFEKFHGDAVASLKQIVADGVAAAGTLDEHYRDEAGKLIEDLEARKKEANELVGIIAERGVTSNYQKVANDARTAMINWQRLTMAALGALVLAAVFEFLPALRDGWSWGVFAGRLYVTIAVGLFAGYAGAEARENQKVMRENRQREMDLAAVGPYLESLPEEMRQKFRLKLAVRIFTPPIEASGHGTARSIVGDTQQQAKALDGILQVANLIKNSK